MNLPDYDLLISLLMRRYSAGENVILQREAEDMIDLLDRLAEVNGFEIL